MSKLTKEEVANWIRNLIPYLEKPVILTPKGTFENHQYVIKGGIIEYDSSLLPVAPSIIPQTENLKVLTELYKVVAEEE